jgi:hypothetical protein
MRVMRNYEVTREGEAGPMRLKAADTGRVLAVISVDEARQLWINLGAALGPGTSTGPRCHTQGALASRKVPFLGWLATAAIGVAFVCERRRQR